MIANAGITLFKPFLESKHHPSPYVLDIHRLCLPATVEEFHRVINVNLLGASLCYQYAGKQMVKQGRGGRIIGACSGAGKQGLLFFSTVVVPHI